MTKRKSIGSPTGSGSRSKTGLRDSLISSVLGAAYATPRAKKPAPPRNWTYIHTDAVVLEIRRLYEQRGMRPSAIVAHLASAGHTINTQQIANYLSYSSRSQLVPTPGADTYLKTP